MLYPELHLGEDNGSSPSYIRIIDTDRYANIEDGTVITISHKDNPMEILVGLLTDFNNQYRDGYDDGYFYGLEED